MDATETPATVKKPRFPRWLLTVFGLVVAGLGAALLLTYRPSLPRDRITILFTQEIHGSAVSCSCYEGQPGGLARLPAAAGDLLHDPSTLLLDAGDFVHDPPIRGFQDPRSHTVIAREKWAYLKAKHEAVARVMLALGYDAVAPGDRDFLLGQFFLLELEHDARFPWVNANLRFRTGNKRVFQEHRLFWLGRGSVLGIPFGGIRTGVFGLISAGLSRPSRPQDAYDITADNPELEAHKQVARLGEAGARVIVLLYHGPWNEAMALARAVPGIDLIVVGQAPRDGYPRPVHRSGDTWLVQVGPGAVQLGRADLVLDGGRVQDVEFTKTTLEYDLDEDLGGPIMRPYRAFQESLASSPLVPLFLAEVDQPYGGPESCKECHEAQWKQWSTTKHAEAFESLVERWHSADPQCLQCHTTGFGWKGGFGTPGASSSLAGVGCEVCHGPRSDHAANWKRKREEGSDLPEPKAFPNPFSMNCILCHDSARDPHFSKNEKKRRDGIRHLAAPTSR